MALRFLDSFDHYTLLTKKWTTVHGAGNTATVAPRTGSRHFNLGNGSSRWARKTFPDAQATWIVGAAWRFASSSGGQAEDFFNFMDGGSRQCDVRYDFEGGELYVTRAGTQIGSSAVVNFVASSYYYIEVKATIHNTTGAVEVRVNGVTVINLTNQDTQATANANANTIGIGEQGGNANSSWYCDDLYVCDTTGSAPTNTFLGDTKVEMLLPSGNGNTNQYDGSDGNQTDNYLLVDETADDGDTTYAESADVGDKDLYAYGDLVSSAGTVYGVQICPYARKTDAGARSIRNVARTSATEVDSAADIALSDGYVYYHEIRETKPGGGAWTISDVNASEFGTKIAA